MSTLSENVEAVESFLLSLADLTVNSKPLINILTNVAQENSSQSGAIAKAVSGHLKKVPGAVKLPILFLIDSIIKNIGGDYIDLFSPIIANCFADTYTEGDDKTRQSMWRLRQSWEKLIPSRTLHDIDAQLHALYRDWPLNTESLLMPKKPLKILVNRDFLPSEFSQVPEEDEDEADVLRQQLLIQKRIRDLEKKRKQADLPIEAHAGIEDQRKLEISISTFIADKKESTQNQADSTTIDGLPNVPAVNPSQVEECLNQSTADIAQKKSGHDKLPSGQLLNLLSDLIKQQSTKVKDKTSDKRSLVNDDVKHELRTGRKFSRESDERTKYSEERCPRKCCNCSHDKSYKVHRRYSSSRSRDPESQHSYTQRFKGHDYRFTKQTSGGRMKSDGHSQSDVCGPEARSPSQKPKIYLSSSEARRTSPCAQENLFVQTSLTKKGKGNYGTDRNLPKRKLISGGMDDGPPKKANSLNNASKTGTFPHAISGSNSELDLSKNQSDCQIKKKMALLPSPLVQPTLVPARPQFSELPGEKMSAVIAYAPDQNNSRALLPHPQGQHDGGLLSVCNSVHSFKGTMDVLKQRHPKDDAKEHWQSIRLSQKVNAQSSLVYLPPTNRLILEKISQDSMKTLPLNNINREVRFFGEIAVIGSGSDEPREVFFEHGEAYIIINDRAVLCAFHKPEKELFLESQTLRVRLGAPTREVYINDEGFQCIFNSSPVKIQLSSGEILQVQLQSSTPPTVRFGALRQDLVAGQVILNIDAMHFERIFLDAKPQRFDINGTPLILKFADALGTILINDHPVNMQFGGPPIAITVNGERHLVSISELPSHITPSEVHITSMARVRTERSVERYNLNNEHESYILEAFRTKPPEPVLSSMRLYLQTKPYERKARSRLRKRSKPSTLRHKILNGYKNVPRSVKDSSQQYAQPPQVERAGSLDAGCIEATTPFTQDDSSCFSEPLIYKPDVNVHELFQSLCSVGILKPQLSPDGKKSPEKEILEVDFKDTSTLKGKRPRIVEALYSGTQCSSCGERFSSDNTELFREHLDSHFQQNHKLKHPGNWQGRKWYCVFKEWIQPELAIVEKKDLRGKSEKIESSVPSRDYPGNAVCDVCQEKFEEFFHDDEDEWHLKDCMSSEGKIYHPTCFKDCEVTIDSSKRPISSACLVNLKNKVFEIEVCSTEKEELNECETKDEEPRQICHPEESASTPVENAEDVVVDVMTRNEAFHGPVAVAAGTELELSEQQGLLQRNTKGIITFIPKHAFNLCNKSETKDTLNLKQKVKYPSDETDTFTSSQSSTTTPANKISIPPITCSKEQSVGLDLFEFSQHSSVLFNELEPVILKPKLVGRRLVKLPPAMKGSETSNLCCVS